MKEAQARGFALYNNSPHLCVDIPDGQFTITTKDSRGRRVTFAFMPYQDGGPPQCVDIVDHDGPTSEVLLMPKGRISYDSRILEPKDKPTAVVLLIEDKE